MRPIIRVLFLSAALLMVGSAGHARTTNDPVAEPSEFDQAASVAKRCRPNGRPFFPRCTKNLSEPIPALLAQ